MFLCPLYNLRCKHRARTSPSYTKNDVSSMIVPYYEKEIKKWINTIQTKSITKIFLYEDEPRCYNSCFNTKARYTLTHIKANKSNKFETKF